MLYTILNKAIRIHFVAMTFLFCVATYSFAGTFYVDNISGSDDNPGTKSLPWETLSKVNSSKFQPGDQILFARGRIWKEPLVPSSSGVKDSPIIIGAYGTGEKPIINGSNASQYTVTMNQSYVTLENLHITAGPKNNIGHTKYTDNVVIQNCLIDKAARMGIYTGQSASVNATNWVIQYNTFQENGTNTTLDHAIYCKYDKNWVIQNNNFLRNAAFGINLNGTSNSIVRYNYSEGHKAGFMQLFQDTAGPSSYNQIYYNISNGDRKFLFVGGGSDHTGNVVYNNTAYNYTYAGLDIENNSNLSAVSNNIFWSTISGSHPYAVNPGSSIKVSSNNDLFMGTINYNGSSFSSLAEFKKAYPNLEANSISADPLFVKAGENFELTADSPCRDKGLNLSLVEDFSANFIDTKTNTPDLGAIEYQDDNSEVTLTSPKNLQVVAYNP